MSFLAPMAASYPRDFGVARTAGRHLLKKQIEVLLQFIGNGLDLYRFLYIYLQEIFGYKYYLFFFLIFAALKPKS